MIIRQCGEQDREQLFSLVGEIENFNAAEIALAREVIGDALRSEQNGYRLLVAVDRTDRLYGFICFGPVPITETSFDLYWIAVRPREARRGIGSLLLSTMEGELAGRGNRVYVDTSSTAAYDSARAFYERHGYDVACVLPDFYRAGDDKIIYVKDV